MWGGRGTGWGRQKLGTTGRRAFERDTQARLRGGGHRPIERETLVCGGQRRELLKQRAMRNSHRLTLLRGFRRRRIVRRRRVRIALPSGLWSRTLEANEAIPQACGRPHPAQHPAPSSRAARPSVEGPAQVISRAPFLRKPLQKPPTSNFLLLLLPSTCALHFALMPWKTDLQICIFWSVWLSGYSLGLVGGRH